MDYSKMDNIVKNIFQNENVYRDAYGFFIKRPLYPFLAYVLNFIVQNEYIAFLLPVFIAYIGLIFLCLYFTNLALGNFFSIFATSIFVSFYPFLDWSTYFLTDTIGAFFYFLQLFFIFQYLKNGKTRNLYFFALALFLSLLNREQSLLMVPLLVLSYLATRLLGIADSIKKRHYPLLTISAFAALLYVLVSYLTSQKNIIDTLIYTMNSYGLSRNQFSLTQIVNYVIASVIKSHVDFAKDLVSHHWWFVFFILAFFQAVKTLIIDKKPTLADVLIFTAAFASYLAIFIYPVLSYRFFYPVVIAVVYFSTMFIKNFAKRVNGQTLSKLPAKL
jgi:hypothetical protein